MEAIERAASATIPTDTIEAVCDQVKEPLEAVVHQFCDEAYGAIMESVQDYLRENAVFNIKSKFDAQQREYLTALRAHLAIEGATSLFEAKSHARAIRKGTWSLEKAEEIRAEAISIEAAAVATEPVR